MRELISTLWNNRKTRLFLCLSFGLLVGWIIFTVLSQSQAYTAPPVRLIPFSTNSHAEVVGNDIYSFDGIVFSKTNPSTGKRTVLSRPVRYPAIDSIWYVGDKGALATFTGGFDSTPAEKYVYEYGLLDASETVIKQNYVWYIDFLTGDISMVSSEYADNFYAYYDTVSEKAYILSVRNHEGYDTSVPLPSSQVAEFDPSTKTIIKSTSAEAIVDADGLFRCGAGVFCVIGATKDGVSTLSAYKDDSFVSLASISSATFTPTNEKDVFLVTKPLSDGSKSTITEDDPVQGSYSVDLFNVTTKQTTKTNIQLGSANGILVFFEDGNLSVVHSSDSTSYVSVYAKNRLGWSIAKSTETDLKTISLGQPSYAEDGTFGIIRSVDTSYISVGHTVPISSFDQAHYRSVLSGCMDDDMAYLYDETNARFVISMVYSSTFQQKIDTLASCVYQDTSKPSEVMLHISLISPSTGQVVSD